MNADTLPNPDLLRSELTLMSFAVTPQSQSAETRCTSPKTRRKEMKMERAENCELERGIAAELIALQGYLQDTFYTLLSAAQTSYFSSKSRRSRDTSRADRGGPYSPLRVPNSNECVSTFLTSPKEVLTLADRMHSSAEQVVRSTWPLSPKGDVLLSAFGCPNCPSAHRFWVRLILASA
jgi:hypothetical protein